MTAVATRPAPDDLAAPAAPSTSRRLEVLLLAGVLLLGAVLHAWNMFGYPYFENDEATYLSRGWMFVTEGRLDVTTYRYDHAPLGWMFMGGWLGVIGGSAVFGGMLETGRVLMLLVHVANTAMVYVITKRIAHGRISAGLIAALVFSLAPLGIYFQRRVLLDNVMVLLVLLAFMLLLRKPLTLGATIGSGITFGLAVLAKLNAAFFGLGFIVLLWARSAGDQRKHALMNWIATAAGTMVLFVIYALLNNEFFPAPLDETGMPEHVSLIDTFALQLGRGETAWPWDSESGIRLAIDSWLIKDTITLIIGSLAVLVLIAGLAVRRFRDSGTVAVIAMVLGYVAFLARGGIVIDLYITPLLPFLAIAVGLAASRISGLMPTGSSRTVVATALAAVIVVGYTTWGSHAYLTKDETSNQHAAVSWITRHADPDSVIVSDNYAYPALAIDGPFSDTMYFFNAEYDPELRAIYGEDWRNIDYLVLTHEVVDQIAQGTVPGIANALEHAELAASFTDGSSSFIDIDQRISTNGDWAQVWAIKSRNQIVLQDAWERFQGEWVVSYGQTLEDQPGATTSLDQALAMEQALAQGDEAAFRGVWQWTTNHLRHRQDDALTSWQWLMGDIGEGEGELGSPDTVCAADQRFMSLLLEAADTWSDTALRTEANQIAESWWTKCTFVTDDLRLVDSSADGAIDNRLVNPSYFDPVLYRQFSQQLPDFDWNQLIDDGYTFLSRLLDSTGTIPNWVIVTPTGEFASTGELLGPDSDNLGEDTLRLVPTLLKEQLSGEARASAVLSDLTPLVIDYADESPGISAGVTLAMIAQVRDVGQDPARLYREHVAAQMDPDTGTWDVTLADFAWTYSWHRFQEVLPSTMTVPIL